MNTNEELIKDARAYLDDGLDDPKALVRALADRLAALTTAQEAKPCGIAHPFRDAVCVLPEGHEPGHMCEMALDGAPEPDREAQLERVAARLREIVYLCGDDLGCQCEEAQDASADLAMELSIIAAERPTLTANEVWAIAKAEHDYANDSDNVGAFVDSLTDALRTAGVAFDEQPFIDSGYLLPVEGEKP